MGDPNNHLKRLKKFSNKPKRTKPDRRWTLLFIGDHGRVITLKRFKGFVFFAFFFLALAAVGLVLLYWQNRQIIRKNEEFQSSLELLQKRIKDLRHEKDILMARLVLAESAEKEAAAEKVEKNLAKAVEEPVTQKLEQPAEAPQNDGKNNMPVSKAPAELQEKSAESQTPLSVAIEDFQILYQPQAKMLKIQYKVKNTTPNSERVAGHTVVVLKGDEIEPENWIAVPPLPLIDGQPTGKESGYSFAINYFKTMRFTSNLSHSPEKYTAASVYVFTRGGELLQKKDFPVRIAPGPAAASEKSVGESERKASAGNSVQEIPADAASGDQKETSFEQYPLY